MYQSYNINFVLYQIPCRVSDIVIFHFSYLIYSNVIYQIHVYLRSIGINYDYMAFESCVISNKKGCIQQLINSCILHMFYSVSELLT